MKKYAIVFVLCLAAVLGIVSVLAAGDEENPLISLSYLTGTYQDAVNTAVQEKLNAAEQALWDETRAKLAAAEAIPDMDWAETWAESRLKSGDVLWGSTGLSVLVLAGDVVTAYESGEVVDVSTGETVPSGTTLTVDHRYLVTEDTIAYFTVTGKTAVVDYMGLYGIIPSDAIDYNAMADALKTIHLFRGSHTGFGSGYDLEVDPTRLQALIMFIRVLGEEESALAYTETPPFTDVHPGTTAAKYVGYAYEKGYTNGYKDGTWRPGGTTNVYQYTSFLLRALGHSVAGESISLALQRAQEVNMLTAEEATTISAETFLRAHLAYLSYRSLDVSDAATGLPLRDVLIYKGVFTAEEYATAVAQVNSSAIS